MPHARHLSEKRAKPWKALGYLSLALTGLAGMAESGALVRGATPTGQDAPSSLFGLGQISRIAKLPTETLNAWHTAAAQFPHLRTWLLVYSLFTVLFTAGYVGVGRQVFPLSAKTKAWQPILLATAGANLIEQVGLCVVAATKSAAWGLALWLHIATMTKWLGVLALAVWFVCRERNEQHKGLLRTTAQAIKVQRFSAVVVGLLLVLAIARMSDILEQLPDIERAWLGSWWPGVGQLGLAILAQLLLALQLLALGRRRVLRAIDHYVATKEGRQRARPEAWVVFGLVLLGAALVLWAWHKGEVDLAQAVVSAAVLILVPVGSLCAQRWASAERLAPKLPGLDKQEPSPSLVAADGTAEGAAAPVQAEQEVSKDGRDRFGHEKLTQTVGDALALGAVAVTGLGLVRSMTAPALLAGGFNRYEFAVVFGILVGPLTWLLGNFLDQWSVPQSVDSVEGRNPREPRTWRLLGLTTLPFLVAAGFLIATPFAATHFLGVLATAVVALGTLGSLLSLLAYRVQTREPLPLFRAMGLASTPAISLMLVISVIGGLVDSRPALHQVQPAAASNSPASSPSFDTQVQEWLDDPLTTSCAERPKKPGAPGEPEVRVEPMILVAAAGGGIRAAWWAEQTLSKFTVGPCHAHAIFAVSAVSGGSIGTAILASESSPKAADDDMTRLAGPDALAAAMDGLLLRDTITGFTGVRVPSASEAGSTSYPDRAALMETAWENQDPALKSTFPLQDPLVKWQLLFNSTAVGTGCRAVIASSTLSPLDGQTPAAADHAAPARYGPRCDLGSGVAASGSYDFLSAMPCMKGIPIARAAQLSARFPFVTPSGIVTCTDAPGEQSATEQYVDGGYADSSGLATLADLAPTLTTAVREYNATAVAHARPGNPITLVVPVVAALGNTAITQPSTAAPAGTPEPLVPTHTASIAGAAQLTGADALLEQLLAETSKSRWLACGPADTACNQARKEATDVTPDQLVTVSPTAQPGVPTPLGWTLSPNSQDELGAALTAEQNSRCTTTGPPPPMRCLPGVGYLGDLLAYATGTD